jgi:selenocysteine lyase/cysteine desulfurase
MSEKTVKSIMEQAQVFASSWSMVGGPFAAENQLELAEEEKAELEKLVTAGLEGSVGVPQDVGEMIEALLAWHKRQADQLQKVIDNAKEGVTLQLGIDDPIEIVLTKDMAKGLRMGLVLALERLGKLPISVSHDGDDDPDFDDE